MYVYVCVCTSGTVLFNDALNTFYLRLYGRMGYSFPLAAAEENEQWFEESFSPFRTIN